MGDRERKKEEEVDMATVFPPAVTQSKIRQKMNAHRKRLSIIQLCCHGIFHLSSLQSQKNKKVQILICKSFL